METEVGVAKCFVTATSVVTLFYGGRDTSSVFDADKEDLYIAYGVYIMQHITFITIHW